MIASLYQSMLHYLIHYKDINQMHTNLIKTGHGHSIANCLSKMLSISSCTDRYISITENMTA